MSNKAYNEIYGGRDAAAMGSSEPSQAMLDQMRGRLASLSDEARNIRNQVPRELEPDVERIQQQMQRLGERLSALGRGALVPYNPAQRANAARVKTVRYVTEEDVRVARVRPDEVIALGSTAAAARAFEEQTSWDEAAAKALYELYESGEAYLNPARREMSAVAMRGNMQAMAGRGSQQSLYGAPAGGGMPEAQQRAFGVDENWLDQRFADIAARIEQSLAQIRPETALASLGRRFDQLETQLNSVLGHVATRADLDELRAAEAQIEEIASQLGQFRRQLARLDIIDAHLGTLTSQLSDERLTRLFSDGVHVSSDAGRLDAIDAQLRMIAVQLSDERLSGLVTRSASRDANYEEIANAAAQRTAARLADTETRDGQSRDIGEMRGMLENLIHERRNSDENNASMLETMQQAIIRVLDRMDVLEDLAQQAAAPAASQPAPRAPARAAAEPPAPAPYQIPPHAYEAPAEAYDDLIPPTAKVYAEMPRAESAPSSFLPPQPDAGIDPDMQAYQQDIESEQMPPRVPLYTTSSFDLDAAFSRSRDAEAESFGEPPAPKRSMEVLRHDFIADAHRAKLKAASKPDALASAMSDLRAGELSVTPREGAAEKPRRRSIFSFRSQRVAMSILVILAAIPAAIFFMPRTPASHLDAADITPAAIVAPMPKPGTALPADDAGTETAPLAPAAPGMAPSPAAPAPKQMKGVVPPLEKGEYEDASGSGSMDTASLPGISMQDNGASSAQVAQMSEQARMAQLSGQLGLAAAKATPASLMEEHVLRSNGVPADAEDTPASGESKLPPATVGPFSLRLAAAQGDASAQFEVASRLAEGKGTDQDLKEAATWYHRAAANGLAVAQFRLGTLYERGLGVKPDLQRSKVWYERAAAQGNVKAMHNLAVVAASANPKGDYESAARWFKAAADYGLADSQYNLAVLYENGMGVTKDMQQAYKWLLLAAKSGDKDAAGRRDAVKAKLSAEDLAEAESQAETFRAKPVVSMVNDARLAGQAWRDSNRRG